MKGVEQVLAGPVKPVGVYADLRLRFDGGSSSGNLVSSKVDWALGFSIAANLAILHSSYPNPAASS